MTAPFELSACEALDALRRRELSPVELLDSCLRRIEACESDIQAWTFLDPDAARVQARALTERDPGLPMYGLPIGVKDVIDTADMPTEYGCRDIFRGWRPRTDAACVVLARQAGAVVVGKTVTPAFACGAAVATSNPRNLDHTAGGSSSGSAAAVAAAMVPIAFGTQTASSVIRPASYTGIVGMRPSMGLISVAGLKYFSGSFDTLGLIARTVEDVELMWSVQVGVPFQRRPLSDVPLRVAVCRPPWLATAEPCSRDAIDEGDRRLRSAGVALRDLALPPDFAQLPALHHKIQTFEIARSYAHEYERHRDHIDSKVRSYIEEGLAVSLDDYLHGLAIAQRARKAFADLLEDVDCLLTAAAPGEAPKGIRALGHAFTTMGDPGQSRAWTLLHVPAVTVPCHTGPTGLPVGIQLIGKYGRDADLLRYARIVERHLTPSDRSGREQATVLAPLSRFPCRDTDGRK